MFPDRPILSIDCCVLLNPRIANQALPSNSTLIGQTLPGLNAHWPDVAWIQHRTLPGFDAHWPDVAWSQRSLARSCLDSAPNVAWIRHRRLPGFGSEAKPNILPDPNPALVPQGNNPTVSGIESISRPFVKNEIVIVDCLFE